jgi:subfamily B ATP-binding cassette protein MsbA
MATITYSMQETTTVRLWRLIKPYSKRVTAAIFFSIISSGLNGAIAWLVKPAMDYIFVDKRYEYIMFLPAGIFILYVFRGGSNFIQAYLMRTAGFKLICDTREKFYKKLVNMPVERMAASSAGDMVSRLMNDIGLLGNILSQSFSAFLLHIPSILVLISVALYRKWDLALLSFIMLPFIAWGTRTLSRYVKKRRKNVQHFLSLITQRMGETASGLKIIKIFSMQQRKMMQFKHENRKAYRQFARLVKLKMGTKFLIDCLSGVAVAIILGYGAGLVVKGTMTSGEFFSVLTAIVMAFTPMKKLGAAYSSLQESIGVLERVDRVLDYPSETESGLDVLGLETGLEFKEVRFVYNENSPPVLKDINLTIPAGKIMAIVGPSGAGKSTLADLIPRFYSPSSGKILWDNTDISLLNIKSLRKQIAVVTQDVILFSDTIRENIAAGKPDASLDEIVHAAKQAQAHGFIEAMPNGYDTMLGERGLNLSGGQRQRIAFARALLKNPPLLILDEATSALDSVSEQAVQKALDIIMKDRTTIVIAHRLSTIHNAHKIVVMDQGAIVARGTHEELLKESMLYQDLYLNWQA